MTNKTANNTPADFERTLTTFESARREQLRRWAALPLEEMGELAGPFQQTRERRGPEVRR
jgi:hypothetical protein